MEKLIIDRSKWRTGSEKPSATGKGPTLLLNDEGFMCCLGFFCINKGLTRQLIRGTGEPSDIPMCIDKLVDVINYDDDSPDFSNTSFTLDAMEINDADTISREEREKKLTELFSKEGITLEFVGEYVDFHDSTK